MEREQSKPQLMIVPRVPTATGGFASSLSDKGAERAEEALEGLGDLVGDAAQKFWSALETRAGDLRPSEVELALEIALEGKQTWILVEGKASAKASVRLKWSNKG